MNEKQIKRGIKKLSSGRIRATKKMEKIFQKKKSAVKKSDTSKIYK